MDVREKLVGLLFNCTPKNIKTEFCGEKIAVTISQGNIADYLIAHGVTVQEWISVKDRLPERDVKVLTFGVYGFSVNYLDRFSGKWRGVNGRSQWITHWMPLPQPPKGE